MQEQTPHNNSEKSIPSVFQVPEGYFDRMSQNVSQRTSHEAVEKLLAAHRPQNVFQVADGYFDRLPWLVKERIAVRGKATRATNWGTSATLAVVSSLVLVLVGTYVVVNRTDFAYEKQLSAYSKGDIIDYLTSEGMLQLANEMMDEKSVGSIAVLGNVPGAYQKEIMQEIELEEVDDLINDNEQ